LFEYVLRVSDHDEVRLGDHDGHEVGEQFAIAGIWVVESIGPSKLDRGSERVVLRLA
jgi:hypothetical protein